MNIDVLNTNLLHPQIDADLRDVKGDITSNGHYQPPADGQLLWPEDTVSDIWPETPPGGYLHVFIQLSSVVSTAHDAGGECFICFALPRGKHPTKDARLLNSAETDDYDKLLEYIRTSPLVCGVPSTVARASEFRKSQAKEGRILNDRPNKDERVTPIALLYAPFGRFLDHIRDRPEKQPGVDLRNFQSAVDAFASAMCEHFKDEDARRDKVLPLLNAIFDDYHPFELPHLTPAIIPGKIATGVHAKGPAELIETVVEFKNEFGTGQTDPEIQTTSYCLQMFDREKNERYKDSFQKYLCPSMVISIIGIKMRLSSSHLFLLKYFISGSYIGFGAFLLLDKARFVALTPLLPARSPSGDDTNRSTLFHAFRAACVLRHDIHEDTQRVIKNSTLTRIRDRCLPYIREIPAWPPSLDRQLEFRILRVAYQDEIWNENRFLFHAEAGGEDVLVKFTRRYSTKLHAYCSMSGHAPRLLGYGTVPGGWNVVVMEDVKPELNYAEYAPRYWAKWYEDLTSLMGGFHEENLVHGDLRTNNIIVPANDPENIMLIDFDWGGEAGRVSFPTWSINEELFVGDRLESLVITKEHDVRVLNAALDYLRPETPAMVVDT